MRAEDLRSYKGTAHWSEVEDAYGADPGHPLRSTGEYVCGTTRRPETLYALEHWRGLFGGIPGGFRTASPDEYVRAQTHGQVQEITQVPFLRVPGRERDLRIPGSEDLHQLTPSASFQGYRGPTFFPDPIEVPEGTEFVVRWIASQQDRGAHLISVFHTVKGEA